MNEPSKASKAKTKKHYFYETTEVVKNHEKHYTVYEVKAINGNVAKANRKARTIAIKRGKKLAGGSFHEDYIPYDFKTNYTIVKVPDNTKPDPDNAKDLLVGFIIDYESGDLNDQAIINGFQKLIDTGIAWSLQGSYGRMATNLINAGHCKGA